MAHSDKNILVTPNIGSTTADPKIVFSGADASTGAQNITLQVYPTNSGTLSFEGSAGQLFSITNSMSGTIYSVNDVSGIPSIEVLDTGLVKLAQYSGNVLLGTGTDNATDKLQVAGSISSTVLKSTVATGTAPLTVTSTTAVANLNADMLDGNHASAFYLATNPSGYTTNTGTVTSVGGTGSVSGLTLSGTVTTTGNLTLGGTLAVTPSNFASQTANTFLAAPTGVAGVPTFRAIVAADIPTLNQNTTGTASNVTGTVAIANGGTGATTAAAALTNLGAYPATNPSGYTTNTGTVTSVAALTIGTTGTDISSTVATGTTTPVITLNIPTASATNRGALSAADWTTFNNKTSNTGTVTSVTGTGTVSGLTLSGTVTTSGNLTLGGTLAVTPSNFASQTANYVLAAPNGAAGVPTFRALVAADVPTLNQNTTGTASNVTGTVAIANGGTGATTAAAALTNLGAYPATNPSGYTTNTGTVTSVSGTGTVSGLTLTGTVTTSGNLTLGGTLSASIDNISDEHRVFNNMGNNHSTTTDFNAVGNFGVRYLQGGTNGPTGNGQWYGFTLGLGNDYTISQYASQLYWSRKGQTSDNRYIYTRDLENGTWGSWVKMHAGYADTAGNGGVTSVNGQTGAVTISGGATVTDDTTTNATRYIVWEDITSGSSSTIGVSSTKLYFNPSTGTLNATIFNSLSDATVKTNVAVITNAVDTLNQVDGVSFNWVDNGKKSYGVIAQEIEKILPDVVDTNENGIKSVNYSALTGFFIQAIKELSAEIEQLKQNK